MQLFEREPIPNNWQMHVTHVISYFSLCIACAIAVVANVYLDIKINIFWLIGVCLFPTCSLSIQTRTGRWPRINVTRHTRGKNFVFNYTDMTQCWFAPAKMFWFEVKNSTHQSFQTFSREKLYELYLKFNDHLALSVLKIELNALE